MEEGHVQFIWVNTFTTEIRQSELDKLFMGKLFGENAIKVFEC